jgi:hypothetical protein
MAIEILRDYIDHYEVTEKFRKEFEAEWVIVAYDDLRFPITQNEIKNLRHPVEACLIDGCAGGLIGFIPSLIIGFAHGTGHYFEDRLTSAGEFLPYGLTLFFILGALVGVTVDKNSTIKESRKPRQLE